MEFTWSVLHSTSEALEAVTGRTNPYPPDEDDLMIRRKRISKTHLYDPRYFECTSCGISIMRYTASLESVDRRELSSCYLLPRDLATSRAIVGRVRDEMRGDERMRSIYAYMLAML